MGFHGRWKSRTRTEIIHIDVRNSGVSASNVHDAISPMKSFFQNLRPKLGRSGTAPSPVEPTPKPNETVGSSAPVKDRLESATRVLESAAPFKDEDDLVLEFSDFLRTIPASYLNADGFDVRTPMRFGLGEIARCLLHGQSSIPLAEIVRRAPDAFRGDATGHDSVEIRFPWQKVITRIKESATAEATDGGETLVLRIRQRHDAARAAQAALAEGHSAEQSAGRDREKIWFTRKTSPSTPPTIVPFPVGKNGQRPGTASPQTGKSEAANAVKPDGASGLVALKNGAAMPPALGANGRAMSPASHPSDPETSAPARQEASSLTDLPNPRHRVSFARGCSDGGRTRPCPRCGAAPSRAPAQRTRQTARCS